MTGGTNDEKQNAAPNESNQTSNNLPPNHNDVNANRHART